MSDEKTDVCEVVGRALREALDPRRVALDTDQQRHLAACDACQGLQRELGAMREALTALPPPSLPASFDLAFRRRLAQAARTPPRVRRRRRFWIVAAAAAAVALVGFGGWLLRRARPLPTHHLRLTLVVRGVAERRAARFEVTLPAGFSLHPAAGDALSSARALRWRSELQPGASAFALPLLARGDGPGRAVVRVAVGGRVLRREVSLSTAAATRPVRHLRVAWNLGPPRRDTEGEGR